MFLQILRRVHENAPAVFKGSDINSVEIIRDIVGIRPARTGGVRVEKDSLDGQNVVHTYGMSELFSLASTRKRLIVCRHWWWRVRL